MSQAYTQLVERIKDFGRLGSVEQLLDWDQEVNMPDGGGMARAEQLSLIAGLVHQYKTSEEVGRLLHDCGPTNGEFVSATNVREMKRAYDRAVKVPAELVKKIAHTGSRAKQAWAKARSESNFADFAPWLSQLLDLRKQEAEHVGYANEPYDAMLDEYEPGARADQIEKVFTALREATTPMLRAVTASKKQPDEGILTRRYPIDAQQALSRRVAELLNFEFSRGRADVSVHPFCTTIAPHGDVRITTRYQERALPPSMFGTMHEVGHALYEQGLLNEHAFTPMGQAVSLGIHESQSRLWENIVGRSRAFWEFFYPELKKIFPDALGEVSLDGFYGAVNAVRPSFIRVEADELTYNLHIVLRFEMERALFTGKLAVKDVPEAWNQKMSDLLGIRPPNDAQGCLQDIHWAMGSFGYFPTYALGNLYASQFYQQAEKDIPDLTGKIRTGHFRPLLDWLRANIHQHGQRYRSGELVEKITGKALSADYFLNYAKKKFGDLYSVVFS